MLERIKTTRSFFVCALSVLRWRSETLLDGKTLQALARAHTIRQYTCIAHRHSDDDDDDDANDLMFRTPIHVRGLVMVFGRNIEIVYIIAKRTTHATCNIYALFFPLLLPPFSLFASFLLLARMLFALGKRCREGEMLCTLFKMRTSWHLPSTRTHYMRTKVCTLNTPSRARTKIVCSC